jgi:hypothetical protein
MPFNFLVEFPFKKLFNSKNMKFPKSFLNSISPPNEEVNKLEEDMRFLKSFVNSVLPPGEQMKEVYPVGLDTNKSTQYDKFSMLYLIGLDKENCSCNIEIKMSDRVHYSKRMLYHSTNLYERELKKERTITRCEKQSVFIS